MKKNILIALACMMILSACGTKEIEITPVEDHLYGVWADENSELVRTGKYSLFIERASGMFFVTLQQLNLSGDILEFNTRGIAVFDSTNQRDIIKAKDLLAGDEVIMNTDAANNITLSTNRALIENGPDKILINSGGKIIEEIDKIDNTIRALKSDGTWRTLPQIESISPVEPYSLPLATDSLIGECLQSWSLGTGIMTEPGGHVVGIPINTNRHSYIFSFGVWEDVYAFFCRAVRIRSNNNGSVYSHNIMIMKRPDSLIVEMPVNNLAVAGEELTIVDSLFDVTGCVTTDEGIQYWSLKAFEDSIITLNGDGQFYYYVPISKDSKKLIERFKYEKY
jgi:hypothetical protein